MRPAKAMIMVATHNSFGDLESVPHEILEHVVVVIVIIIKSKSTAPPKEDKIKTFDYEIVI